MSLVKSAVRGLRATIQGGIGAPYGRFGRGFPGGREGIDFRAEAGSRVDNSIVYACIARTTMAMLEAPIIVQRPGADGKMVTVHNHPITLLMQKPVPWYSGEDLRACWIMSEILTGNAFTRKRRSGDRKIIGLEYIPLSMAKPVSTPGSGNFIDYYECILSTGIERIKPEDMLHTKWVTPNGWTPALSIGPLEAVLASIATDNRAARYEYGVLKNGTKAHMLTPRGQDTDGRPLVFGKEQRQALKEMMEEEASGDNAGSIMAVNFPFDSVELGWKPKDMSLGDLHDVSEERICACIGCPSSWVGMGSGLESDSNKATRVAVNKLATHAYVLPYMRKVGRQLTWDLVPELGEEGDEVCYDLSKVAALQEELRDEIELGDLATAGPTWTVNEWRARDGRAPVPGGDVIRGLGDAAQPARDKFEDPEDE